ncbi:MAG: SDR family oxidoreductase, partial [Fimbriimonadaceae bacterium]|nr:SDR family oxidoreductase [Alphaproteobacteria bacterium]
MLEGKVAIVTGGGGGIGGATCARFGAAGSKVGVLDINVDAAKKVADKINASGGEAVPVMVDITDLDIVTEAVAAVESALGPVDILVNNAGWDVFRPFLSTTPDQWQKLININLVGALNMHYAVLPGMVERGYGRVVNVSSDAGRGGSSGEAVYGACKAGLIVLSKSLAREHARHG